MRIVRNQPVLCFSLGIALGGLVLAVGSSRPGIPAADHPYSVSRPLSVPRPFARGIVRGSGPSFTPDGNTVYTFDWQQDRGHTILVSRFQNSHWTPSRVAEFSGVHDDLEPCVSADGTQLLFTSSRPLNGQRRIRIWRMRSTGQGWTEPEPLGEPVNLGESGSGAPSLASDGTLFFGSDRRSHGWPWEIFSTRPGKAGYREPEPLGAGVNSDAFIWTHAISPDSRTLVFSSERPGGYGRIDLYVSRRDPQGKWTPARNLGNTINTQFSEVWPRFSPDGKYLFFCREGETETIYQVEWKGF